MKTYFEVVIVPDNPLMPSAYPPVVILEAEKEEQVREWFRQAQEQGQFVGNHIYAVVQVKAEKK